MKIEATRFGAIVQESTCFSSTRITEVEEMKGTRFVGLSFGLFAACGEPQSGDLAPVALGTAESALHSRAEPVGLSLLLENGVAPTLRLTKGPRRFLQELDIVERVSGSVDDGITPLLTTPSTSSLDWSGVAQVDEQWIPGLDGTFTRERYYRGANWMERKSSFVLTQRDVHGRRVGKRLHFDVGSDNEARPGDDAVVRRFSARQRALGCPQINDCSGAAYIAEALIQARDATHVRRNSEEISARAVRFDLGWSAQPDVTRTIEVEQRRRNREIWGYGFGVELAEVGAPPNGQFYEPGDTLTLRVTFEDGDGNRLHAPGSLPTFEQVFTRQDDSGLRYLDPTFPTRLYYAFKHRESTLITGISGPLDALQAPQTVVDPLTFFLPQTQFAFSDVDGYTSVVQTLPPPAIVFGGLQDPTLWQAPVSDTMTFVIPDDALPGTYVAVVKARREYRGEALNRGAVHRFQVGQSAATPFTPTTRCNECHTGPAKLNEILHGIDDRATCYTCHSSLAIEVDNRLDYRVHRVHALSERFPGDVNACSTCHTTTPSGPALGL
jgi:hypothetical protein